MKKILTTLAVLGLISFALPGCGGPEQVETTTEDDGSMDQAQQEQYQQMMESGYGSSRANAPKD